MKKEEQVLVDKIEHQINLFIKNTDYPVFNLTAQASLAYVLYYFLKKQNLLKTPKIG